MVRKFHLRTLLSVITGAMLCPSGDPQDFFDLLNHMTADTLDPHEIAPAMKECRPYLIQQFPFLPDINIGEATPENFKEWLSDQTLVHGELFKVTPLPPGIHQVDNDIFRAPK
jgi:hypothetical protein